MLRQGYFFSSVPILHTRICQRDGEIWCVLKHDVTKPNVDKYVFHCQALGETDEWKTKISWLAEEQAGLSRSKLVELLHFLSKS